ncbi:Oligopeptide transport ATP-binding protein OppF [subsurface metagenome]
MKEKIIELKNLKKYFYLSRNRILKAVDNINIEIYRGETFGLVGESGCGKSTLGRTIKGIYKSTAGQVIFEGKDISKMNKKDTKFYMRYMQMIFQDPYSSLNPRMIVKELISEGLEIHKMGTKDTQEQKVFEILYLVGLSPEYVTRYAHEFSGGQRQRLAIARALAVEPKFIICDEPISALDVSIQGQIVNLLKDLQEKFGLTYLFIAHDLSMTKYISDRIGVMYMGRLVEIAEKRDLFENPKHPYTQALLSSIPIPNPRKERERKEIPIEGEIPSPLEKIAGCSFKTRCQYATAICDQMEYKLIDISDGHSVMCTKYY